MPCFMYNISYAWITVAAVFTFATTGRKPTFTCRAAPASPYGLDCPKSTAPIRNPGKVLGIHAELFRDGGDTAVHLNQTAEQAVRTRPPSRCRQADLTVVGEL